VTSAVLEIRIASHTFEASHLHIFRPGGRITAIATRNARLLCLGAAALQGPRYILWDFVFSRLDRIQAAKAGWQSGRFKPVPGASDNIPLPE